MRRVATFALLTACVALAGTVQRSQPPSEPSTLHSLAAGPQNLPPTVDGGRSQASGGTPVSTSEAERPENEGGLTLLASSNLVQRMWSWCRDNPDPYVTPQELPGGDQPNQGVDRGCSWRFWLHHTDLMGPGEALDAVLQTRLTEPGFVPECHHSLHGVGQRAAVLLGVPAALSIADPSCQAGYIHGVIQEWTTMGSGIDGVAEVCLPLTEGVHAGGPSYSFCGHGVGHALALRHPDNLRSVVSLCETLVPDLTDACVEGAVMEFSGVDHVTEAIKRQTGNRPSDNVSAEDRRNVCDVITSEVARERCWMKVFMLFEHDVRWDQDRYIERCMGARLETDRVACLASWSEQATSSNPVWGASDPLVASKADDMFSQCARVGIVEAVNRCIALTVEIIWRDEPLNSQARSFCPLVDERWREACAIGDRQASLTRQNA